MFDFHQPPQYRRQYTENEHGTEADFVVRPQQVNRAVHTIVLRACGLSREEVSAIQAKRHRRQRGRDGGDPSSGGGGGVVDTGEDGMATQWDTTNRDPSKDPLPWREEKRLGFRAACLRDWLVDAAR